jgi:hypothetical protein
MVDRCHGLLGMKWWSWAEHTRVGGPKRHGPGLHKPSPRVISRSPRDGEWGG